MAQPGASGISIGICASDASENLPQLIGVIGSERLGRSILQRIIVVASGCSLQTLAKLKTIAGLDDRILVIEEAVRLGKSEAVNRIIENSVGEVLVLVNSDAFPEQGSINTLVETIESDTTIGAVSASPYFERTMSAVSDILELVWALHNDCSLAMNHSRMSNHASDELIAVNSEALQRLPVGIVNDGAYIAGVAYLRGFQIRFSDTARVKIDVPRRLTDLIRQRRRIIFGHFQVWRRLGKSPRTVELMLFSSPSLSLHLFIKRLASTPRLIKVLPFALICESFAFLLAVKDIVTSTGQHAVWRRSGN